MKNYIFYPLSFFLFFCSAFLSSQEITQEIKHEPSPINETQPEKEFRHEKVQEKVIEQKIELDDFFKTMSIKDQKETGILKLSPAEQKALVSWVTSRDIPLPTSEEKTTIEPVEITNSELTITEISKNNQQITLSNGLQINFTTQTRKKIAKFSIGDAVRITPGGKRGVIGVTHASTGAKIKGRRNPAPQKK